MPAISFQSPRPLALDLKMRNISLLNKPHIDVQLNRTEGIYGEYITSFVTLDQIEGMVHISAKHDTKFDDIEIAFVGITKTFVDRLSAAPTLSGRAEATHRFLRLIQPMNPDLFPTPRILEAGRTYSFPFTFVVPDRLLPRACPHRVRNDHIREQHLQLPPSLGEAELSGYGGKLLDDLAPEMAKITYAVRVTISRTKEREDDDIETIIAEKSRKIRIKPSFDEHPPLSINPAEDEYSLRTEKSVRRGLLRPKTGRLVMESAQPRALMLPHRNPDPMVTTMLRVNLRFDPVDEAQEPPKLCNLVSKMKVTTFFASAPRHVVPVRANTQMDFSQGFHAQTVPLAQRCVSNIAWMRHTPSSRNSSTSTTPEPSSPIERRDSALSNGSASLDLTHQASASSAYSEDRCATYHTAHVLVPISLPPTKNFVPTFHTCLISRVYAISLHLSLASSKASPSQTLSLRVPIQIAQEGSPAHEHARRMSMRMEEAGWEVDEVFEPRRMTVVGEEVLGRNEALGGSGGEQPPGYEVFGGAAGVPGYTRNVGFGVMVVG
ncbi:hypothetical protein NA57DRAFT_48431 [Rhizodiscina lignyota]|uniref:Arrestin-like N-terminal domain-containing protein n=1 Tax=Rhizodiscina lignyota TaxID=1504668 RepID=A0A9P4I562_9PEZI|nr:hypothetical protein NA57DRAFT_48431 [Rhizodiscina lignyota]